eukprot:2897018-Pyramimonas_sp.AAC.2
MIVWLRLRRQPRWQRMGSALQGAIKRFMECTALVLRAAISPNLSMYDLAFHGDRFAANARA